MCFLAMCNIPLSSYYTANLSKPCIFIQLYIYFTHCMYRLVGLLLVHILSNPDIDVSGYALSVSQMFEGATKNKDPYMNKTQQAINKSNLIAKGFIAWNILFFILSLIMRDSMDSEVAFAVLLRGGVYALGGLILLYLLHQMAQGKRSGWLRLSIICVLAPLGVVAFIAFTPGLPLWFDTGQIGSAIMLAAVAGLIVHKDVRREFPKNKK